MSKYWIAPQESLAGDWSSWSAEINFRKKEDFDALNDDEALAEAKKIIREKYKAEYPLLMICRVDPRDSTLHWFVAQWLTKSREFITVADFKKMARRVGMSEQFDTSMRIIFQG